MKKQKVLTGIPGFRNQSSANQKVLLDFLNDKANNHKWLNYTQYKLFVKSKFSRAVYLEPEDYISEAKVIILDIVSVSDASTPSPRFTVIKNGKSITMSRSDLSNYFILLIKWNMSHVFRKEQRIVSLPHWNEDSEGDPPSEDDTLLCSDNPESDYIVPFNDPFNENLIYQSKEFFEKCCRILEKENNFYRLVFEELLNGSPNRDIAAKYKVSVRKIENIRKIINRRLKNLPRDDDDLSMLPVLV